MKFSVGSKTLYNHVTTVGKVIASKNAMSVLNNFRFSLEGNLLTVTASDVENTLSATMEVTNIDGDGMFCADAKKITDLLKELPDQGITFEINDSNFSIKIRSLNGDFNLIGINGVEYPETIETGKDSDIVNFVAPASQINSGLENTLFAAGNDEIWPQMMGVFWDIKPENITFVATDSRKLVRYIDATAAPGVTGSFILPSRPGAILKSVLTKSEDDVKISIDGKSGNFVIGNYTFNCRFIKGQFPDYNRVIPQNNQAVLSVERTMILNAIRRVAVFVEQGHGLIKFQIEPGQLTLKAEDNALCTSGLETIPCNYNGSRMVIGFGSTYLIEIFSTLQSEEVELRLSDPSRPGLFVPSVNEENTDLVMLLMPMTVSQF